MKEITFVVREDEIDGGYTASAHWPQGNRDIFTEGDTRDELIENIREALQSAFSPAENRPEIIHLQFIREETIAVAPEPPRFDANRYPLRGTVVQTV